MLERSRQLAATIAALRVEDIASETLGMHAHQRRHIRIDLTTRECKMMTQVGSDAIKVTVKLAEVGGHLDALLTQHEFLRTATVLDELRNRAGLETMTVLKIPEVTDPRHRAIVVDDFTNHRRLGQTSQTSEINRRLGVARSTQHTTGACQQGKHMARPHEGIGAHRLVDQQADRVRAVRSRDAGAHALRGIDTDGECSLVPLGVAAGHLRQIEFLGALGDQWRADQSAAVHRHEVHHFRRAKRCGTDQIGLIFARGIIRTNHQSACRNLGDDFINRAELDGGFGHGKI